MTAFNYARTKATADRLITRFGRAATLTAPGVNEGPRYAPSRLSGVEHACTVVETQFSQRDVDGVRVLATDKRFLVAVNDLTITPEPDWLLKLGNVSYTVVSVDPLQPGATLVMWTIQCRVM